MKNLVCVGACALLAAGLSFGRAEAEIRDGGHCNLTGEGELTDDPLCYTISDIQAEPTAPRWLFNGTPPTVPLPVPLPPGHYPAPVPGGGTRDIGQIVNIFNWFWEFIRANQSVLNAESPSFAAALPLGVTEWRDLENWQGPAGVARKLSARNPYRIEVIRLNYTVSYMWGGTLGGKGKFLTNVTVIPERVWAAPLGRFQLDANVNVSLPTNYGTKEDPVAGLQVIVTARMTSIANSGIQTQTLLLKGDGTFEEGLHKPRYFRNAALLRR